MNGFSFANGETFDVLLFKPGQLSGGFSELSYGGQTSTGAINIGNGLFMVPIYDEAAGTAAIEITDTVVAETWTAGGSGSWTDPANWTPSSIRVRATRR